MVLPAKLLRRRRLKLLLAGVLDAPLLLVIWVTIFKVLLRAIPIGLMAEAALKGLS